MNRTRAPRLKALDLQGYKTFASQTRFEFAPTVTAIVGPNGSGKSNIADAIRWVLGEQSFGLLRGKRTEDMIFAGSESRPRSGLASASITFDNSDGWLPIDFSEVSIGRRASRDGQNEYLINGQKVRLRDVAELLAKCGLSQRTYTVIGQGLVDAVLSLKAEERSRLFEEAAGIGLYRSRREESLRRLETTRRNLERVRDILAELRPRLRSLERQVQRAQDYEQIRSDLMAGLRDWYGYHWYRQQDFLAKARDEAGEEARIRDDLRRQVESSHNALNELGVRIGALRTESHQLDRRMRTVQDRLGELARELAVAQERLRLLHEQEALLEGEIENLQAEQRSAQSRLEQARREAQVRAEALEQSRQAYQRACEAEGLPVSDDDHSATTVQEIQRSLEQLAAREGAMRAREEGLRDGLTALEDEMTRLGSERQQVERRNQAAMDSCNAAKEAFDRAGQAQQALQDSLTSTEEDFDALEARRESLMADRLEQQARVARLEARLQALQEARDLDFVGVEDLIEAGARGELTLSAHWLRSRIEYQPQHAAAIQAALGVFEGALLLEDHSQLDASLNWFSESDAQVGAALIALDHLSSSQPLNWPESPDIVGVAARLVDAPAELLPVVEALLGHVLVVQDRTAARRLQLDLPPQARVVTLQGEVFYPNGLLRVGRGSRPPRFDLTTLQGRLEESQRNLNSALQSETGLKAELEEQSARLEILRDQIDGAQDVFSDRNRQHENAIAEQAEFARRRDEIDRQRQALEQQRNEINNALTTVQEQRSSLASERVRLETALKQADPSRPPAVHLAEAELRLEAAMLAFEEGSARAQELQERESALNAELAARRERLGQSRAKSRQTQEAQQHAQTDVARLEAQLDAHQAEMTPLEAQLAEAEARRAQLEADERQARLALNNAESRYTQAQIELARRQEEVINLERRIQDDFGLVSFDYYDEAATTQEPLPMEGLVERLHRVEALPSELEKLVNRLRAQLRRMGSINVDAQREFREVKQRLEFLDTQVADLRQAETHLQQVIAELDLLMEREFRTTFDQVAVVFRESFSRLFGGGSARLRLLEDDDPTRLGIEIDARLPGRREQGLAMLSGGERSLTASALIFSLLKISPTPFCVLDEVDAMLDETNVIRYGEMLRELSQESQFVIITHNRQTIQVAEIVYGISMGSDSASKVISLRLDEAEKALAN